jgi:hypothetical protein
MATQSDAPLRWESLGGAISLLRLWQDSKAFPQLSIMRVSNSDYLKFSQDPLGFMKFVNQQRVFSKHVIEAGPWVTLSSVAPKNEPPDWVLMLLHGKMSTMLVAALPQLIQEEAGRVKK